MKRLVILFWLTSAVLSAQDKTPYKFIFGGNSYYGPRNASVTWLAQRYDAGIAGLGDWPGMFDSIYDTAAAAGKDFWCGPYASSQEINLYDRLNPGAQYNERLTKKNQNWLYIYAKHYMDSIGVSPESLVVHINDNFISMSQNGDGFREYSLSGLPYHKRRFTYQYWNNNASDTMFYPAGYTWLANGYNRDTRQAIAYAYRRHLIEDSLTYGPGDHHWTAYFMDNQYRGQYAPRLSSYYTIYTTSGGPTGGLDWVEQPGIGNDYGANQNYYDRSTMLIDSTIDAVLDSTCAARGLHPIHGFANVDKFSAQNAGFQVGYTNINLENPVDYGKAWPNGWEQWYAIADTMARHPERYINWLFLGDFLCSADPGNWRYDSSRIYLTHYAFFLQVRDTNAFCGPARFNDSTRWRDIYEVDFGKPDGPAYEVSSIGTGYDKVAVMRRNYGNGSVAVLLRTSHGSVDWVNDSVAVNMHFMYREVDVNADTSSIADSIFYLKPYMGKVLITTDSCGMPPSSPIPLSPPSGSSTGSNPTLCVSNAAGGECAEPISYQFQISENTTFSPVVRQSVWIGEGNGGTCYLNYTPLNNGKRYYWRCRAYNGTVTSGWSAVFSFITPNSLPAAPTGYSPPNLRTVDKLQPTLVVNKASDPDGTSLLYYFQVSKFSNFSSLAAYSGGIPEDSSLISWKTVIPLENGSTYYWRVRAFDGIAYGAWMSTRSFNIDADVTEIVLRGDVNVNGVAYEVADAVVFSNYFISGLSAFGNHVAESIASTDANADGITLSVADLVQLVRVLTNEADPIPKALTPGPETPVVLSIDNSGATVSAASRVEIGAAFLIMEYSGVEIGNPYLPGDISDMSLKYGAAEGIVKILIYSFEKGRAIPAGTENLLTIPISGSGSLRLVAVEMADYFGHPIPVSFDKGNALPDKYTLYQNRPNPFNAGTTISYDLPVSQHVLLEIFDLLGRRLTTLVDEIQPAGTHSIMWDGTDSDGTVVASGIYFYRISSGSFRADKKMVLLK